MAVIGGLGVPFPVQRPPEEHQNRDDVAVGCGVAAAAAMGLAALVRSDLWPEQSLKFAVLASGLGVYAVIAGGPIVTNGIRKIKQNFRNLMARNWSLGEGVIAAGCGAGAAAAVAVLNLGMIASVAAGILATSATAYHNSTPKPGFMQALGAGAAQVPEELLTGGQPFTALGQNFSSIVEAVELILQLEATALAQVVVEGPDGNPRPAAAGERGASLIVYLLLKILMAKFSQDPTAKAAFIGNRNAAGGWTGGLSDAQLGQCDLQVLADVFPGIFPQVMKLARDELRRTAVVFPQRVRAGAAPALGLGGAARPARADNRPF